MFHSIADFEGFFQSFREVSSDRELEYLADAVFVTLWLEIPGVEKRFKYGIGIWTLWAIAKCLATRLPSKRHPACGPPHAATSSSSYGFRLLTTPAHHDSLVPILDQISREQCCLYGHMREDRLNIDESFKSGLSHCLSVFGLRTSLRALTQAIGKTFRIRRTLARLSAQAVHPTPSDFIARLAELIFRQQLELALLRRSPCTHKATFLTYELIPEAKAWVRWARESGARVIHVMHGQRLPTYQVTMATDLLLFSKVDEPWFRERVDPQVKIWTIGHPRLEMIRQQVGLPECPSVDRLPRIAFFSQPSEGDYSRELRLEDWSILAGLKGRAEVRFRLHPRESKEIAVRDLKNLGAEFIELSEAGLKEDLSWCDAVASSWSTVSMEAAACGRGVFWTCTTPEKYEASRELQVSGIGALIRDAGDWKPYLDAWNHGGWQTPVIVPDHRLNELGMIGDMARPWLERLGLEASVPVFRECPKDGFELSYGRSC
jgi:hypothetical protein